MLITNKWKMELNAREPQRQENMFSSPPQQTSERKIIDIVVSLLLFLCFLSSKHADASMYDRGKKRPFTRKEFLCGQAKFDGDEIRVARHWRKFISGKFKRLRNLALQEEELKLCSSAPGCPQRSARTRLCSNGRFFSCPNC